MIIKKICDYKKINTNILDNTIIIYYSDNNMMI